jgi:hypothetical protein
MPSRSKTGFATIVSAIENPPDPFQTVVLPYLLLVQCAWPFQPENPDPAIPNVRGAG